MNFKPTHVLLLALLGAQLSASGAMFKMSADEHATHIHNATGKLVLTYQRIHTEALGLPILTASFFHPFTTPKGVVLTDLAPKDHPHHRGIFMGYVETHGEYDGDFWGWGEHAPVKDVSIYNDFIAMLQTEAPQMKFNAKNDWAVNKKRFIKELLRVHLFEAGEANVLDLTYELTPVKDVTISQWAFSGFCVRSRKDGSATIYDPDGKVDRPAPVHTKPESNWPDKDYYALHLSLPDDVEAGVAVINHPRNPRTTWHNHIDLRMLNPATCAPTELKLKGGVTAVLRYRVVGYDGKLPKDQLKSLAREFRKIGQFKGRPKRP